MTEGRRARLACAADITCTRRPNIKKRHRESLRRARKMNIQLSKTAASCRVVPVAAGGPAIRSGILGNALKRQKCQYSRCCSRPNGQMRHLDIPQGVPIEDMVSSPNVASSAIRLFWGPAQAVRETVWCPHYVMNATSLLLFSVVVGIIIRAALYRRRMIVQAAKIEAAAQAIVQGDASARAQLDAGPLARVGRAFDEMASKVE